MAKLGPNVKLRVPMSERSRLKDVMLDVFEAKLAMSNDRMDIFDLEGTSFGVEVIADASALSAAGAKEHGTWLEFVVDDPSRTRERLEGAGIGAFEYADKKHDYYQLPGGQVVRIAARK